MELRTAFVALGHDRLIAVSTSVLQLVGWCAAESHNTYIDNDGIVRGSIVKRVHTDALPSCQSLFGVLTLIAIIGACSRQPATPSAADQNSVSAAQHEALSDWSGPWALSDDSFQKGAIPDTGYGGFGSDQGRVPLRPKYLAIRNEGGKRRAESGAAAGNLPKCLPAGMPGMMQHPLLFEVLNTPGRMTFIFEDGEVRRIHTDGRKHPDASELQPDFSGNSVGHWEAQTLVVDTIGVDTRADLFMASTLRPTANMHIVERMRLENKETLRVDTTITDDELFTVPYQYTRTYSRSPLQVVNASCLANNRDDDQKLDLTPPAE